MTAEEWDTRRYVIFSDLLKQGVAEDNAHAIADLETAEQFGDRPNEEVAK